MNILITGSEGFVGRNLVEQFLNDNYRLLHPTVKELDLTSAERVDDYFRRNSVSVIIHSATTQRDGTSYPDGACENNLRMFFNLARNVTPEMKLINFGTGLEYSRKHWHHKMPEDFFDKHVPEDSIGFSKYLISKHIQDHPQLNMVSLRIFGIYGKYEDYRYKFISNAIAKNLLHLPIIINQNAVYDYLHVADFYKVVKYFVDNKPVHKTYNVTPTDSMDLVAIANTINELGDFKSDIQVLNSGIGTYYSGDNRRLVSEMKDFKVMDCREGLADLYGYYRENISLLDRRALENDDYLAYAKKLKNEYFPGTDKD